MLASLKTENRSDVSTFGQLLTLSRSPKPLAGWEGISKNFWQDCSSAPPAPLPQECWSFLPWRRELGVGGGEELERPVVGAGRGGEGKVGVTALEPIWPPVLMPHEPVMVGDSLIPC